jgi:hypothetical protein
MPADKGAAYALPPEISAGKPTTASTSSTLNSTGTRIVTPAWR